MTSKLMKIDEFIANQSASANTASIEAIDGKPEFVKVTPWSRTSGCLCHLALEVRKSSLDSITPTGDVHICCGKMLKVVELHFKKGETIAIEDVFGQIQKSAAKFASPQTSAPPDYAPGQGLRNVPHPPFNCWALSGCAESPGCGGSFFCPECDVYRLVCAPWLVSHPIIPPWHSSF